ncbi:MAG TPA: Gfo/Idh/MocA family oxidoreductase [Bryobacteraceae bacterium]|nr:Gfo/Idh/MocA family oxidoreductase [Bryobacteraceae bacterium]
MTHSRNRKLRMGMVGGGQGAFIGAVHRIAAALDQQVELVAGSFSRDFENTLSTGEQLYLDPSRCYRTYEEMAAREVRLPEDRRIDFVSVVTPNNSHFSISKTFLEMGFHVVCDKPMTFNLQEAVDLARVVERTGLVFALTHNYTGHPLVRHARELFRSGQLGTVRKVIVEYLQDWLMAPLETAGQKQASWRVDPAQSGLGGALGDIGTHAFNLAEYITGDPVAAVCADTSTFLPNRKLDEDANVLLRFEKGGKGVLTCSQIATGEENGLKIRVYASEGAILWAQENPNEMHLYRYGQPRQILTRGHREYLSAPAAAATRIPVGHPEGYLEAFANIYAGAVRAIRAHLAGQPLKTEEYEFPTVYDGVRGLQFITQAVESAARGGAWMSLERISQTLTA